MVVVLCTADTDNSGPGRTQVLLLESWGSSHCVLAKDSLDRQLSVPRTCKTNNRYGIH